MADRTNHLQDAINGALTRLLVLGGADVDKSWAGEGEKWDYLDPLETMLYAPPSFWLDAAAQHLCEIVENCDSISRELTGVLRAAEAGEPLPEDGLCIFFGYIDDLEFHLFTSHLHTHLIRDAVLLRATSDDCHSFRADLPHTSRKLGSLGVKELARRIAAGAGVSLRAAQATAKDIEDLAIQCGRTGGVIRQLGSEPEAERAILATRFSNVQSANAELAQVLVRADVSCRILCGLAPAEG